jgi:Uma2 family endonuclease
VVVEVLSDSTEKYDRGDKFEQYQTVASLRDYVLVSQKKVRIEHFRKQADGTWVLRASGPGDRLVLASIGCELAVDMAYLKVPGFVDLAITVSSHSSDPDAEDAAALIAAHVGLAVR